MKKYSVRLASLLLFFATGATIGMEEYRGKVYLTNRLITTGGKTLPIEGKVIDKEGNARKVILENAEETKLLGDISSIAQIEVGTYLSSILGSTHGEYSPTFMLANKLKPSDDITKDFLAKLETDYHQGDVMKIIVDWKYPESSYSREWKYTFVTGVLNPSIGGYPWNWVINNTGSEILVQEVVDPNSLYAQEAAEQGLSIENPIKIAPAKDGKFLKKIKDSRFIQRCTAGSSLIMQIWKNK